MKIFIMIVFSIYFVAAFLLNLLHLVTLEKSQKKEAVIAAAKVLLDFFLIILFVELRHYI